MAVIQRRRFCRTCRRLTLHERRTFHGGWGCLLSILTAGLFLPVWLLLVMLGLLVPYRCQRCGGW